MDERPELFGELSDVIITSGILEWQMGVRCFLTKDRGRSGEYERLPAIRPNPPGLCGDVRGHLRAHLGSSVLFGGLGLSCWLL